MAGDWIKMRKDLADDPAVIAIAAACQIGEDLVVGKLHRAWSWADSHTTNGNAPSVTLCWLDRYVGVPGFAKAMCEAGWLIEQNGGISFPNFDRHNGKSAKRRALTANRVSNARVTQQALQKRYQRREEKSIDTTTSSISGHRPKFVKPTLAEVAEYCLERGNAIDPQRFLDHYESNGWRVGKNAMRDWRAAVRTWEKNQNGSSQGNHPAGRQPTASREQDRLDRSFAALQRFANDEGSVLQGDGRTGRPQAKLGTD